MVGPHRAHVQKRGGPLEHLVPARSPVVTVMGHVDHGKSTIIGRLLAEMDEARGLAVRLGDRHGEMFALEAKGLLLAFCNRFGEALPVLEQALARL